MPQLPLINNTEQVATSPVEILVNRDEFGYAKGRVLFDNGTNSADLAQGNFSFFEFVVTNNSIQKRSLYGGSNYPENNTSGVNHDISAIYLFNSINITHYTSHLGFACMIYEGQQPGESPVPLNIDYDESTNAVVITSNDYKTPMDGFKMKSIYFGNSLYDADVI